MAGGDGVSVGAVLFLTIIMAMASGIGAVPFFFVGRLSPRWSGIANALACGVMIAASFDLVHEGEPYGSSLVVAGVCVGALFIARMHSILHDQEDIRFSGFDGADARKTFLMIGIMTAHALGEGCGVGVSFSGAKGWAQGQLVALAIGVHNVPEGMAVAAVLHSRGSTPWTCASWAVVTSLPQPLLAVPSFAFVETFQMLLPFGLGFAAGCMVWIVFAELLPDAARGAGAETTATFATLAAAALEGFRMLIKAFDNEHGYFEDTGHSLNVKVSGFGGDHEHISVGAAALVFNNSVVDSLLPLVAPTRVVGVDELVTAALAHMVFPSLLFSAAAFLPSLLPWLELKKLTREYLRRLVDVGDVMRVGGSLIHRHRSSSEFFSVAKTLGASSGALSITSLACLVSICRRCSIGSEHCFAAFVGIIVGSSIVHLYKVVSFAGSATWSIARGKKRDDEDDQHNIVGWAGGGSEIHCRDTVVLNSAGSAADVAQAGMLACVLLFATDGANFVSAVTVPEANPFSTSLFHSAPKVVAVLAAGISAGFTPSTAAGTACAIAAVHPITMFLVARVTGGRGFALATNIGLQALSSSAAASATFRLLLPAALRAELNPGKAHEGIVMGGVFASAALIMSWLSCRLAP